jgi:hypothetical protein
MVFVPLRKQTDVELKLIIMKEKISLKKAWHSTDGWRGYEEPVDAVCGANDTGTWYDSPCNSNTATAELNMARSVLRKAHIPFKSTVCRSSNVFCVHRYICVPSDRKDAAKSLLEPLRYETHLLYIC